VVWSAIEKAIREFDLADKQWYDRKNRGGTRKAIAALLQYNAPRNSTAAKGDFK